MAVGASRGDGYTYFGDVFDRFMKPRGYNQTRFAAECRRRGYKVVSRRGGERDVGQRSMSEWMRGVTACPPEIPTYADAILVFSWEERSEFGMAYAYGQKISTAEHQDLRDFWEFYGLLLAEERARG